MAIRMSLKGSLHFAALRKADVMARDIYGLQLLYTLKKGSRQV